MRPVNLIPPEQRRGERTPLRTGPASYLLVGVLAAALVGVTGMVLTNNDIADREAEKASLEARKAAVAQEATELAPYAEFATLEQARRDTVSSLAQSRFDWERVLRELAIVLPPDVWLVQLTGTVSPDVQLEGGAEVPARDTVAGPALEFVGCGASHEAVARFVAALEDIDGVTRVGVDESQRPDVSAGTAASAEAGTSTASSGDDCRTRDFIARFEIIAAFDAASVPPAAEADGTTPAPTTDAGGVPEASAAESAARESQSAQAAEAQDAAGTATGSTP